MVWNHVGPSHWMANELPGYEIHARCKKKPDAKTIFDSIPESWVIDLSTGKRVKSYRNQPHILVAMAKAKAWVKTKLPPPPPEPTKEELEYEQKFEKSGRVGRA